MGPHDGHELAELHDAPELPPDDEPPEEPEELVTVPVQEPPLQV